MPKEFNSLGDWILSHWFPTGEKFPHRCVHENRVVKEAWEEQGPVEHKCKFNLER